MKLLTRYAVCLLTVATLFLAAFPCRADVLYIHDHIATEYLVGKKESDLFVGYTDQAMYIDKKIRYTGKLMTTIFGKVSEGRETTHFLLDQDQIREINYNNSKIIIFPLERLTDVNWLRQKQKLSEADAAVIRERYRVSEPVLSVNILPQNETVGGYLCRVFEVNLRLETIDIKRNSSSVTLIKQKLWVSEAVPGYSKYRAFHEKLAKRLGFDAVRLGGLSGVLSYWDGSLDPIRKSIKDVSGYPVKTVINVEGRYTIGLGTPKAKTSTANLKEESVLLKEVVTDRPVKPRFAEPSGFGVTIVK